MRRKSSTLSDSGRNASPITEDDGFVPRRSTHVSGPTNADGDTWQESLAVCELAGKLTIRSFFSNRRTQERVWDEPPSGASRVANASEVARQMAKIQLQEMQIAMGTVPDLDQSTPKSTPKSKKGFGGFFRRSKGDESSPPAESRIQSRPESFLARSKRDHKKSQMYDEHLDPAMQRALVSSMASKTRSTARFRDAELEHAMALSLLEAENANSMTPDGRPKSSSSHRRSSSRDGHRSNSREYRRDRSEHHGSHGFQGSSAKVGSASTDHQRHHVQKGHSSLPSGGNKRRADPPSDIDFCESADDASIIRYEFPHDGEEALAIALSMSLLDVSQPRTNMGAASMPMASEMTEDEQLAKAMEESMAMSPPELKGRFDAPATGAFTSDLGYRKMPAGGIAPDVSCADILDNLVGQSPPESRTDDCGGLECLESFRPLEKDEDSFSAQWTPRRLDVQGSPGHPRMSATSVQAQGRPVAVSSISQLQFESRSENTKEAVNRSRSPNPRTRTTGSPAENWLPRSPKGNRSPRSPKGNRSPRSPTYNRSPKSPTDNRSPKSPDDSESSDRSRVRARW